ncbi:o-succinylbenzoate synthase [Cumulibacter manganitolerans]|uniref:o-succinylbenzoate synthase n=1 Tax=Cumulibacter manganitolerans TaxID=1884992 RepID=UPI0012969C73|nr:o-succinylbenzoate synthase [Cumulibacter manganitolerans]
MPHDVVVYAIPMRNRFRGITVREGVLWEGPAGWVEFSPFLDYDPQQCVPWLRAAQDAAEHPFPEPVRDAIPVNCTVPAVDAERAAAIVLGSGGCKTAKVKVAEPGQSLADDLDRVAAVRAALGPEGRIRIDANGGWDVDTAAAAIGAINKAAGGLEYAEQPCPTVDDLAAVRRRVSVPIAADESIRRAEDPLLVQRKDAADIAVIKVQPLGGVRATLRLAEQLTLPLVVSSALETSVGLAMSIAVAAALPKLPYAAGLNTGTLLTRDACSSRLIARDGAIAVPARRPVPDLLDDIRADDETRERWIARIADVQEVMG